MKKQYPAIILGLALVAVLILTYGCSSSKPSRFYLLAPVSSERLPAEPCVSLGVGPVKLPEYLDRSQIITRTGRNELLFAQRDRWAEPLSDTSPRIMAQNFSRLLCTKTILVYPYRSTDPFDYRVEVNVMRMDGRLGHEAVLEAWWSVSGSVAKKIAVSKRSVFVESLQGDRYEDFVEAQDKAVAALCREIAEAITLLSSETRK